MKQQTIQKLYMFGIMAGVVIVMAGSVYIWGREPSFDGQQIIKAPKEKILYNKTIKDEKGEDIIQYLYASDIKVPPMTLRGKDEVMDKRTIWNQAFKSINENENEEWIEVFRGDNPFYKDIDGKWYKVLEATTTIEAFKEQTKVSWFNKLFRKQALATTDTYTTSGVTAWVAPAGVTETIVRLWGGGGAGGGANVDTSSSGGGAAGGQFVIDNSYAVTPGNSYDVDVAATVTGSSGLYVGATGDQSDFNIDGVIAKGGQGGRGDSVATDPRLKGTGSTTGGVGDTVYAGGNGADGTTGTGGAGGGGAGTTGAGGNASGITAGTGTSLSGGDGGAGREGAGTGNPGTQAGGGGAGAYVNTSVNRAGGTGAAGRAELEYEAAAAEAPPINQTNIIIWED